MHKSTFAKRLVALKETPSRQVFAALQHKPPTDA
jgi:hypothetical protein